MKPIADDPTIAGPASYAFVAVVPVTIVLVALGAFVLPSLIHSPRPGQSGLRFFEGISLAPEPLEQYRYVLFLLSVPMVIGSSVLLARLTPAKRMSERLLLRASLFVEVLAGGGVVAWWIHQQRVYRYFSSTTLVLALAAGIGIVIVFAAFTKRVGTVPMTWADSRGATIAALLIAIGASIVALLPALYSQSTIVGSLPGVRLHLPFTLDEFAAVANGRTPLVNFVPQYSNVLPYLVMPFLSVAGLSVGTFTTAMFVLSITSLLSVFYVFARVSGRWVTGVILYIPFLSLSLYRMISRGREHLFLANYFAAMPLRYFGPWIVAGLLVWQIRHPSPRNLVLLFMVAGAVMINNPDFGLPSFVGAVAATWLAGGRCALRTLAWARHLLICATNGLGIAIGAFVAISLLRTGDLPNLSLSLYFARQFAVSGFFLLPMPTSGLHLIIALTLAAGLVRAIFRGASPTLEGEQARLLTGALAYGGLFGLGASSYYVGRSHPHVLIVLFSVWAFVLALLLWDAWVSVREGDGKPSASSILWVIPSILVAGHVCLAIAPAWEMRDVGSQVGRMTAAAAPSNSRPDALAGFVRRHADSGEAVLILAPLSHRTALQAGVRDVFPYNNIKSVITYEQLAVVRTRFRVERVSRIFVGIPLASEVRDLLIAEDFRPIATGGAFGRFALWERAEQRGAHRVSLAPADSVTPVRVWTK